MDFYTNIKIFTIGIDDEKYDERKKATEYAKHLKIKNQIEQINSKDLIENIDNHFKLMTEPFGDYSSIPTYAITKLAKKQNDSALYYYKKGIILMKKIGCSFT